jgi:hypothetical protein
MTKRFVLLVLAVLTAALCTASFATSASDRQVPFHAEFAAEFSVAADPAPCAEIRINVVGGGLASHLGRFTTVQYHCTTALDPLGFSGGQYTFTAANGNTIFGTYAGRFVPGAGGVLTVDATFTIDGGTGRFAGATGGGDASGTTTTILNGTISTVGSSRQ